jgi:hypothetical protein
VQHGLVGRQARERQPGRAYPRAVLLRTEEAHAVAACAQAEGQREEGEQVAGGADGDDDVVDGGDGGLLFSLPLLYAKVRRRLAWQTSRR